MRKDQSDSLDNFAYLKEDGKSTNPESTSKSLNFSSEPIPLKTILKYDLKKLNPVMEYLAASKLQTYQKAFNEDKTDPKRAYYYLRV